MLYRPWISPHRDVSHSVLCRKFANIDSLNLTTAYKYCFSFLPQEVKQCIHKVCSQSLNPYIHNEKVAIRDLILRFAAISNSDKYKPIPEALAEQDFLPPLMVQKLYIEIPEVDSSQGIMLIDDPEAGFLKKLDVLDILNECFSRFASSVSVASLIDADSSKAAYEEAEFGIPSTDFSIIKTIIGWLSRIRDRLARQSSGGGWYSRMMVSRVSVAQLI
jgi:hypothetical protein